MDHHQDGRRHSRPPYQCPLNFPSMSGLHAPPSGLRPVVNHSFTFYANQPLPLEDLGRSRDLINRMASTPTMQPPTPSLDEVAVREEEAPMRRGRPKKNGVEKQEDREVSEEEPQSNESKRGRGRPRGTGKKQRLAESGDLMNNSAGDALATHVLTVEAGEDILSEVENFSKQRERGLYVLSGVGRVSSVTLCQSTSSPHSLSFEGAYEILSLSGCYLVDDGGEPRSRRGGLGVSLSGPKGNIGGKVRSLVAASTVQVVICSFTYGAEKEKANKKEIRSKENKNNMETPTTEPTQPQVTEASAEEDVTPPANSVSETDINLTTG